MRKIFSKEEIDKWDSFDYQWARDNYIKDIEEEHKKIKDIIDTLKLYIRPEYYFEENKLNDSIKNNKEIVIPDKNINEVAKKQGITNVEFVVSNINNNSVFDDEIPIIMEK